MPPPTTVEVNDLKKSIHDLSEVLKKGTNDNNEMIQQTIKDVLANHPGFTPKSEVAIAPGNLGMDKADRINRIYKRMPAELVEQADDIFLLSMCMEKKFSGVKPNQLKAWEGFKEDIEASGHKKALDSTTAGGVDEWVPTDFSPQFYELVRLEMKVASLFPILNMPSNPFPLPIQLGRITTFKQAEQTANTGQTLIGYGDNGVTLSGKTILTAVNHASQVLISKEAEEDAIIAMLPFLKQEMVKAMAEGVEDCIMNGDTEGTHEDTDITAAADRRKMWLGLRALSNDRSWKTDLANFNLTNLRGMRKNMGKYGVMPSKNATITGIAGMMKCLSIPELLTVDKYPQGATIVNGEIAKLDGAPLIISEWVREVLTSSGIYGASGTKTVLHKVYRNGFVIGRRRGLTSQLGTELFMQSGQDVLVVTERLTFAELFDSNNHVTEMVYNF